MNLRIGRLRPHGRRRAVAEAASELTDEALVLAAVDARQIGGGQNMAGAVLGADDADLAFGQSQAGDRPPCPVDAGFGIDAYRGSVRCGR